MAYTVVYNSLIPDEEGHYARQVADFLKIPIRFIAVDGLQPFERWNDPEMHWPEPVDDPFFAGLFTQFDTIGADCRVALSGEGSDNLMHFQMWPYVKDMVKNREWSNLAQADAPLPGGCALLLLPGLRRRAAGLFGKDPTAPVFPQWLAPDFARRFNLRTARGSGANCRTTSRTPILPKAHASLSLPHWAAMFEQEHAGVTRSHVEVRYPFLDLRIVNFLLALPPFPYFFEKASCGKRRPVVCRNLFGPDGRRLCRADPLAKHLEHSGTKWLDELDWSADMDSYTDRGMLQPFQNETDAEQLHSEYPAPMS